jgi:hypothetical protein
MTAQLPPAISGVIPAYAQSADLGPPRSECGVGCLMPWNGRLYVLNYVSHRRQSGTGVGLRVIDENFRMTVHPEAVDGTYANRFIHDESNQLIIGPHVIDAEHRVRTVKEVIDVRICGTAQHLFDPQNLVYLLGMEGELFELNVRTLAIRKLFDLTQALGTPGEFKCHFKDCYSAYGRLVVVNNDYSEPDFLGRQSEGTLAEWDGKTWTVLERKPFVCVHGRGRFTGTIFATGWDRASCLLKVFTDADQTWRTYRLPKATHTHEHKWQTEWPRIREVEHERFLVDLHGMFYELSPWAYGNRIWGVKPIAQHLWVHGDFCTWKGMLVLGADNASPAHGDNTLCAEPQSGLWFGRTDDLWKLGKPAGWGGPWWSTPVKAGVPSDPYLMTGFEHKCLHLFHEEKIAVTFDVELDALGNGTFKRYRTFEVAPGEAVQEAFSSGLSAHWLRVVARRDALATAQLHYT